MEIEYLQRLIENLKKFPLAQFNVRDLYGDEEDWFNIPLQIRQDLGSRFFEHIKENEYFQKGSKRTREITGASMYEDVRFEINENTIMYVEHFVKNENSLNFTLRDVHIYNLNDKESLKNNHFRNSNNKSFHLEFIELDFDCEGLPTPKYVQISNYFYEKLIEQGELVLKLDREDTLRNFIYFLKSIPNDDDTKLYYDQIGIQSIDLLPTVDRVHNPVLKVCNVGQANFMYINGEENSFFFDAGYPSKRYRNSENITGIVDYMDQVVRKNDIAFLTHWHDDHFSVYDDMTKFGYFEYFVAPFPDTYSINMYLHGSSTKKIAIPSNIDNFLRKNKTKSIFVTVNHLSLTRTHRAIIALHQSVGTGSGTLDIYKIHDYKFNNNNGVVYKFQNNLSVLFTGDVKNYYSNRVLSLSSKIDLIIYPHHGGSAGKTKFKNNFDELIISCGDPSTSIYAKNRSAIATNYSSKMIIETYNSTFHMKEPYDILSWIL